MTSEQAAALRVAIEQARTRVVPGDTLDPAWDLILDAEALLDDRPMVVAWEDVDALIARLQQE